MMKNSTQSCDTKPTYCAHLGHNFPYCASKKRSLTRNLRPRGLRAENKKRARGSDLARKAS
jgi:hypothetical protein